MNGLCNIVYYLGRFIVLSGVLQVRVIELEIAKVRKPVCVVA